MKSPKQKFAEISAAKKEKKANKPYWAQIVTSDSIQEGTVTHNWTGKQYAVSCVAHFTACSQTKVDPKKGRDSVLWEIGATSNWEGYQDYTPASLNLTYDHMLRTMMVLEKKACHMEGRPDAEVIAKRLPFVAKNNVLHFV